MFIHALTFNNKIARSGGGGGSAGRVEYPDYLEALHEDWLGTDPVTTPLVDVIDAGHAVNPLEGLSYMDPAVQVGDMITERFNLNQDVQVLDAPVDWQTIVGDVVGELDTVGVLSKVDVINAISDAFVSVDAKLEDAIATALSSISASDMQDLLQIYMDGQEVERAAARTRYQAGMMQANTGKGSAYVIGLALLERGFQKGSESFQVQFMQGNFQAALQSFVNMFAMEVRARVGAESQDVQTRNQALLGGVQQVLQYHEYIYSLRQQMVALLAEVTRIGYVMESEYVANTGDLNWKYGSWDFEVYNMAAPMLGALGGGHFVPRGPTKVGSAIGGALSGAGTGALVGSAVPGIGTAAGAAIGGLLGIGSALFG